MKFRVDQRGLKILEDMTRESKFTSVTATVGAALRIVRALQEQAKDGYSDVIVQNPETLEQRMLVIDFLEPLKRAPRESLKRVPRKRVKPAPSSD